MGGGEQEEMTANVKHSVVKGSRFPTSVFVGEYLLCFLKKSSLVSPVKKPVLGSSSCAEPCRAAGAEPPRRAPGVLKQRQGIDISVAASVSCKRVGICVGAQELV